MLAVFANIVVSGHEKFLIFQTPILKIPVIDLYKGAANQVWQKI
jgi:hypothetical protein